MHGTAGIVAAAARVALGIEELFDLVRRFGLRQPVDDTAGGRHLVPLRGVAADRARAERSDHERRKRDAHVHSASIRCDSSDTFLRSHGKAS